MGSYAVEAAGLSKSYGRTAALVDLNLAVPAGAMYVLVGQNGAGKTTLLKVLMNILEPTAGTARMLECDSFDLHGERLCDVGYVSENQELPDGMTVGRLVEYLRPFYPSWDQELEARLLRQFDLPLKRKLKQLSRGMRMKAAFAVSLPYRPKVLILDEPLSGLDPLVREELVEALKEQQRASGMTILISTHDLGEVEDFATHVGFLEKGRLLFSEEIEPLKARFRKVVLKGTARNGAMPQTWWQVDTRGDEVQFIESAYVEGACERKIEEQFEGVSDLRITPLPLRAIFLAVARAMRADAGPLNGGRA